MKNQITERINSYLLSGGLFNPEMANHDHVRDLLIDCREMIEVMEMRCQSLDEGQNKIAAVCNRLEKERDEANSKTEKLQNALRETFEAVHSLIHAAQDGTFCMAACDKIELAEQTAKETVSKFAPLLS